ncbi:AAA family ATPase [Thiomicrorhabdus aquaedulcis]|uniref:bifunctional aminoglycoside phosphotransferase/ATP-binding protein n=1 Tax=Thiomicrorhabdus aquaedulcis TaxID=2211106 RepID=UPI000FD7C962|nr:bifunctional aminoglycoside phosphotransferase/ATP-binding protein [Thiomicrorhabdus aquaedulcis]
MNSNQPASLFEFSELVNALCNPLTYPHPVEVITTIETHISIVFLTGDFAYKLKKPVNFGFLDFSTLANRQHYCQLELTLNRRFAPQLYLAVVPIYFDCPNFSVQTPLNSTAQPVDFLVKMTQFDPNLVLGRLLNQRIFSPSERDNLANQVAQAISQFHLLASHVEPTSFLGEPNTLLQPMLDNFAVLQSTFSAPTHQAWLNDLLDWTHSQFNALRLLLVVRKQQGFVRACHGDLHLDNIALVDEQPVLFDGIEFSEPFRWIDVMSDLAFLLIDLDFRGQFALQRQILSRYLTLTNDTEGLAVLRFYKVYRALVRAKITTLRAQQLAHDPLVQNNLRQDNLQEQACLQNAARYIEQAWSYTQPSPTLKLILLQGVSGSGKSFLTQALLQHIDAISLSSDLERKHLFGINALDRVKPAQKSQLYSPQMNQQTYATLLSKAQSMLSQGCNVLIDATFLKRAHRQPFYDLANRLQLNAYVLYLQTPSALAQQAITERLHANNNPSDADVSVMLNQLHVLEPPQPDEPALSLHAVELRQEIPIKRIQDFLQSVDK